ncbi:uncharacterized protein LOC143224059 [Tachypleus tridentatus]|uniref:uncharacterized protein LOC143224059 n=1 Tax=Tachypleus tridentatus TaxID=6853 RepID=UPI003FCF8B72
MHRITIDVCPPRAIIGGSPQPTCQMKPKILLKRFFEPGSPGQAYFCRLPYWLYLPKFPVSPVIHGVSNNHGHLHRTPFRSYLSCSHRMQFRNFISRFRNSYDEIWKALRRNYIEDINMTFLKKSGFQLEDMIPNIDPFYMFDYVTSYFDPVYGNCYSFNTAWSGAEIRKAFVKHSQSPHHSPTLKSNSFNLLIYLPVKDFSVTPTALITFHPPDVAPNVHNYANRWILKPGRLQQYFFTQKTSLMLEPPYQTNCTDYDKIGTTPARPGLLEENLCEMECLENVTLDACGSVCPQTSPFTLESKIKMGRNARSNHH